MNITTTQEVRDEVKRIFPGLPPYPLSEQTLEDLGAHLMRCHGEDEKALRLLRQQACLAEALEAIRRGEDANYLRDIRSK